MRGCCLWVRTIPNQPTKNSQIQIVGTIPIATTSMTTPGWRHSKTRTLLSSFELAISSLLLASRRRGCSILSNTVLRMLKCKTSICCGDEICLSHSHYLHRPQTIARDFPKKVCTRPPRLLGSRASASKCQDKKFILATGYWSE